MLVAVALCMLAAPSEESERVPLERLDHRGAAGLLISLGGDRVDRIDGAGGSDHGFRLAPEVGLSAAITERGSEVLLSVRASFFGPAVDVATRLGMRSYFGLDAWKTFVDLEVIAHWTPLVTVGPGLRFGVQYEFSSVFGAYAAAGAQIGLGQAIRLGFEVTLGVQLRSYLFE